MSRKLLGTLVLSGFLFVSPAYAGSSFAGSGNSAKNSGSMYHPVAPVLPRGGGGVGMPVPKGLYPVDPYPGPGGVGMPVPKGLYPVDPYPGPGGVGMSVPRNLYPNSRKR